MEKHSRPKVENVSQLITIEKEFVLSILKNLLMIFSSNNTDLRGKKMQVLMALHVVGCVTGSANW